MDELRALKYFVAVANQGSFSAAAQQLHVPASSISRRIADLEQQLGATLLQRNTRSVKLTEVGQEYFQQVTNLLSELNQANDSVRTYHSEPMGTMRISTTNGFGEKMLLPVLDSFSKQYPKIQLDVTFSDELTVLERDNIDIAIRGGYVPNERIVAKQLMDNAFQLFAAPDYLQAFGTPTHPFELRQHKGLYFRTPYGKTPWLCQIDEHWHDVSAPVIFTSNLGRWLVAKAIAGEGLLMLPRWACQDAIDAGKLVEIHTTPPVTITQQPNLGIYLLYQKHRYTVPKIKVMVDYLQVNLSEF